jgi:Zn-dependent M28 family amino/carboxypeptidase
VLTLGHTSEQGAEDNATGVAATLEALDTLGRLIAEGKLPRPKRGIRILSMGEMYGSMHYVQHNPERIRRTVAAMCVDTPAASYDLAGTEYTFYMNPHVAKDFTDASSSRWRVTISKVTGRGTKRSSPPGRTPIWPSQW